MRCLNVPLYPGTSATTIIFKGYFEMYLIIFVICIYQTIKNTKKNWIFRE